MKQRRKLLDTTHKGNCYKAKKGKHRHTCFLLIGCHQYDLTKLEDVQAHVHLRVRKSIRNENPIFLHSFFIDCI